MPSVNSVCVYCCCCCSVAKSCPTFCDSMDYGTSVFSVLHCLPEFAQIHVHWVSDAISVYIYLYNLGLDFRIEVAYSGATSEPWFPKSMWKWKWSCSVVSNPQRPHEPQLSRLLLPWDFPGESTGVGCPLPSTIQNLLYLPSEMLAERDKVLPGYLHVSLPW